MYTARNIVCKKEEKNTQTLYGQKIQTLIKVLLSRDYVKKQPIFRPSSILYLLNGYDKLLYIINYVVKLIYYHNGVRLYESY